MQTSTKLLAPVALILTAACSARQPTGLPILPDPKLTPDAVLDVTKADICVSGYLSKVRKVLQAIKKQAYKEYGITHRV